MAMIRFIGRPSALALALLPGLALAQQATPGGSGPVFPPAERQPTPAEIQAREQARGLPTQEFTRQQDQTVDQIFKDLAGTPATGTQGQPQPGRPAR